MKNSITGLTSSIVEYHQLTVNEYFGSSGDVAFKDGNFYSGMAPGTSFLALPFYGVAKQYFKVGIESVSEWMETYCAKRILRLEKQNNRDDHKSPFFSICRSPFFKEQIATNFIISFFLGSIGGALSFFLVFRIVLAVSNDTVAAKKTSLLMYFGTTMVVFNASFHTQAFALVFLLLSIFLLFVKTSGQFYVLTGSLSAGIAGTIDYPYSLYGGIVILFFGVHSAMTHSSKLKTVVLSCLAFLIPLGLIILYYNACFGNPFSTPYHYRYTLGTQYLHNLGEFVGIGRPSVDKAYSLLFSSNEGLLWLSPFCLLFPFKIKKIATDFHLFPPAKFNVFSNLAAGKNQFLIVLIVALTCVSTLFAASIPWIGKAGAYSGSRFSLTAAPFMVILTYKYFQEKNRFFTFLIIYSCVVNHLNLVGLQPVKFLFVLFQEG